MSFCWQSTQLEAHLKKYPEGLEDRRIRLEALRKKTAGSCSAHLIALGLGLEPDLGLCHQEGPEVLEELLVQEGRLDLDLGLVLEVPVVVEEQEVQQAQQELDTDVLFEL